MAWQGVRSTHIGRYFGQIPTAEGDTQLDWVTNGCELPGDFEKLPEVGIEEIQNPR